MSTNLWKYIKKGMYIIHNTHKFDFFFHIYNQKLYCGLISYQYKMLTPNIES